MSRRKFLDENFFYDDDDNNDGDVDDDENFNDAAKLGAN